MNTFGIIIAIVELLENIKSFFFKDLVFCQISRVYIDVQICVALLWN